MKKSIAFVLSFIIFTIFLSIHLIMVDGSEVYTVSSEDSRFSYYLNADGGVKVKASEGALFKGNMIIPTSLDGKTVTAISERGFIGQNFMMSLEIPESVTMIGDSAFSNCTSLLNVSINGIITDIGSYPFYATPYEDTLEKKGDFVILNGDILYDYKGLSQNISIPNGIRVISGNLFTYLELNRDFKVNNLIFPDSVEYICSKAFYDCNDIININIGTGMKNIGMDAFTSSGMNIMGYFDTYALSYASDHGYTFIPLIPYGDISSTIYAEYSDDFRQYYFSDEKEFSREGVFVYRRNYNGEKIEITDWEYSSTLQEVYESGQ